MSTRRKIAFNIFYLAAGQGLSWLLASVVVLVIPAYLGPEGMGMFSTVSAISGVVAVLALLGTNVYLLREVAKNPQEAQELVGSAVVLCVLAGLVCWSITLIVFIFSGVSDTMHQLIYISAIGSILSVSVVPLRSALQGQDKMQYNLIEVLFSKGLSTVLVFVVIALNMGILVLAGSGLLAIIPTIFIFWRAFLKNGKTKVAKDVSTYVKLVKGGYYFLITDISFNIYLYLDTMLLAAFTNDRIVGYYSLPVRLFGSLLIAPVIVGQALLPSLSRSAANNEAENNMLARKLLQFLICLSIPIAVGTSVMAGPLIETLYKGEFNPSIPILIILGWTTIPTYLGIGLYQILVAQDRQKSWTKVMVMAIFINLGLNVILIPLYQNMTGDGAVGAAISQLATEVIIGICGFIIIGSSILNKSLLLIIVKSAAAALVMAAVIWPLREQFILLPVLLGVAIYGVLSIPLFGLDGEIKQMFKKFTAQRLKAN
ncbi:MAG: flippase [Chloroflexi bacterium]|nr:flippase [Chloroflexota bacterium]OJV91103.1 MAG: hypothetical protein BGO39_26280 [Chloroflexi bacterium 54-19]